MSAPPNRWEVGSTILIVTLTAASSLLGLLRDGHYADHVGSVLRLYAQDVVLLVLAAPALGLGIRLARSGSIRGRFVWLGALAFMTYMWTHYAFVVAYNDFFLGYVALLGLSLFTLLSGVIGTDADHVFELLHDSVSTAIYGVVLAVTGLGLAALWLSEIIPALLADELPAAIVQSVNALIPLLGLIVLPNPSPMEVSLAASQSVSGSIENTAGLRLLSELYQTISNKFYSLNMSYNRRDGGDGKSRCRDSTISIGKTPLNVDSPSRSCFSECVLGR